jgi:hypothetical protein
MSWVNKSLSNTGLLKNNLKYKTKAFYTMSIRLMLILLNDPVTLGN